jgi:PTH1 family peptidyl-tRNA hydrolase
MRLIVGLGNPGRRYVGTRHNVGYAVLAELSRQFSCGAAKAKFHGQIVEADLRGQRALLLSPTTYMNNSGLSVQEAKGFYKIADEGLLVVCDDLNLPLGKLRFRAKGSSGGQKGLEDIARRRKVGIGPTTYWRSSANKRHPRSSGPSGRRPRQWSPGRMKASNPV